MRPSLINEKKLWAQGFRVVVGVDEVGRGAWAGPIVAAAVALREVELKNLNKIPTWGLINDSKKLTPKQRGVIYDNFASKVAFATGIVSNKVIDQVGIAQANSRAAVLAVSNLRVNPNFVLLDYIARFDGTSLGVPSRCLKHGDALSVVIALASILAKVTRDRLMVEYNNKYPGYGFDKHKGYGTPPHLAALRRLGVCPIHRKTYQPIAGL